MYMLLAGHVVARDEDEGGAWRAVARVPEDGRAAAAEVAALGDGRVAVVGSARHGADKQTLRVLSHSGAATPSWTCAAAPPEFTGHVQAE